VKKGKKIVILLTLVLLLSACDRSKDEVLDSLGSYESKKVYTGEGFQDSTDYAKYCYEDVDFSDNQYFEPLTPESEQDLKAHIEDFEQWIEMFKSNDSNKAVVKGYDFDSSVISDGDYLYIYDDPDYPELGNYNVYFFDTETMTLYYFHNNI